MNIPNTPGAVEALVEIANKDGAKFLTKQFNNLQNGDVHPKKLLIHCTSGVGRTGTLMAIINSLICLQENNELSTFSIVRRLREQRFEMCES